METSLLSTHVARARMLAVPAVLLCLAAGCSSTGADGETSGTTAEALTGADLAGLALANVGGRACGTNSLGGHAFESSCVGNGGQPEYWCADFVKWIWRNRGVDVSGLTAASGSFYTYGENHGTLSNTPTLGAAVVFNYHGGGSAEHVAIVTAVYSDGRIETASGDWSGQDGSQAFFASTASVILNSPAYSSTVGSTPGIIGDTISGFIRPAGLGAGGGGGGGGAPPPSTDCSVHPDDHRLHCMNSANAALHEAPTNGSAVVNHLATTYSWFDCWGTGDLHAGGNTTWYHTIGDDNPNGGWAPGVDLHTSDALDANPSAAGLPQCGGSPPPPPSSSCSVHDDGRLYCNNTPNAVVRSTAENGGAPVDTLRTTNSWFDCWLTGDLHGGGNTTWYHTQGDDNGAWGFVPAVDLQTPNALDSDPSANGLQRCP
jgi:hypothetical protein